MDRERLRDAAHKYIGETVYPILAEGLSMMEIPTVSYQFYLDKSKSSDQDPTIILLDYKPVANIPSGYTLPQIRIEVGVRAMMEPTVERPISSLLSQTYNPGEQFGVRTEPCSEKIIEPIQPSYKIFDRKRPNLLAFTYCTAFFHKKLNLYSIFPLFVYIK